MLKRYTLCKLCLGILAVLFLSAHVPKAGGRTAGGSGNPAIAERTTPDALEEVLAAGTVQSIQQQETAYGEPQSIISLTDVTFCNADFQTQSEKEAVSEKELQPLVSAAEGTVLCQMKQQEALPRIGERILLSGKAVLPSFGKNPGSYDQERDYHAKGIAFSLRRASLLRRGKRCAPIRQCLYLLKRYLAQALDEICGKEAGVMQALLLGDKSRLSGELKKTYQKGGISHILAVSGLHISFLGMGLYQLLKRLCLPRSLAAGISGILLGGYVLLVGAAPSACRAGMMFLLWLAAELCGRSCDGMTALSVSALLLVWRQPHVLEQTGFLLSYGAMLGLLLVLPALEEVFTGRAYRFFLPGLSVSFVTLPVLLNTFYSFPVYSLLLNLAVIPLMSVVMAGGLLSLFCGLFCLPLGRALFLPVKGVLWGMEKSCLLSAALPGSTWLTGQPGRLQSILYLCLLLFFLGLGRYRTKGNSSLLLLGAVWILSRSLLLGDTVTMLDVGQGDGLVIRSQRGTAILIDCGSSSEKKLAENTLFPYLKSQKIRRLSYVFVTHLDADHRNGVEALIAQGREEGIVIDTLVLPSLAAPDQEYWQLAESAHRAGILVCTMGSGESLCVDGMRFTCLHPERMEHYADRNEGSMVLHLQTDHYSALFMGDLDGAGEWQLLERLQMEGSLPLSEPLTVLKAGHHGSKDSCSQALLALLSPRYALISCGEGNSYGHPDPQTLERLLEQGCRVYVTKGQGAVTLRMRERRVLAEPYRKREAAAAGRAL